MATLVLAFAAVCLVVVGYQFSCLITYQEPKKEAEAPCDACTES